MRTIGEIPDEAAARIFGDFLCAQGIAHELERGANNAWEVWVKSDDECPRAAELLAVFQRNPADPQFAQATRAAADVRRREAEDLASYRRRVRNARTFFPSLKGYRFGPLTFVLMTVSVVVFVLTSLGTDFEPVKGLWFSEHRNSGPFWRRILEVPELRDGQLWRLLTPIFIHLGFIHILFNLMWLADLGSMIEGRQSSSLLGWLVFVIAVGSNVVEYVASGRPHFGGMSGVVYGLVGYMWIRGKLDPGCGLRLSRETVITSMGWFFFCFSGLAGPIANGAHAGGLVIGMIWGWLASRRRG